MLDDFLCIKKLPYLEENKIFLFLFYKPNDFIVLFYIKPFADKNKYNDLGKGLYDL